MPATNSPDEKTYVSPLRTPGNIAATIANFATAVTIVTASRTFGRRWAAKMPNIPKNDTNTA